MQSEILNCRCCGGALDVYSNLCVCKHCGTTNFISDVANKNILQLNRANKLRQESEFDNAARIYDNILSENAPTADILWYRTLCEYGIEYVPDPVSDRYFPTLHRISDESIKENAFFKQALELSDNEQRETFEKEADYIEEVQIKYLNIAADEKPYDAFICYKETDLDTGEDTEDVKLAEELYNELTQKGYKVFFARETLKEKLSIEYEPYIFAALKSANAMAVIGTKSEYFASVWVKNEWGRFLKLMDNNPDKKMFFACYDPEELPRAFASKQAQILGKDDAIKNLANNMEAFLKETKGIAGKKKEDVISEDQKSFDDYLADKSEQFINSLDNTEFGKRKKELVDNIEVEKEIMQLTNKKYGLFFNIGAIAVLASYFFAYLCYYVATHSFSDTDTSIAFLFSVIVFDVGLFLLLFSSEKWISIVTLIVYIFFHVFLMFVFRTDVANILMAVIMPTSILFAGLNKKFNRYYQKNDESYKELCAQIELLRGLRDEGRKEFNEFALQELVSYKKTYDLTDEIQVKDYHFAAVKPMIRKSIDRELTRHSYMRRFHSGSHNSRRIRIILALAYAAVASISIVILIIHFVTLILNSLSYFTLF